MIANNWQQTQGGSGSSLTLASYTVGVGEKKILLVFTGAKDSGGFQGNCIPLTVLWGTQALSLIASAANTLESGFGQGSAMWGLLAPPAETHDIVVTWPESQSVARQLGACYLVDREQVLPAAPLVDTMTDVADSGTTKWTLELDNVPAGAYVVDVCSSSQTGGTHSATETGAGQLQKINILQTSSFLLSSEREVVAFSDVTFGWIASVSSGRRAMCMAAFRAATDASGVSHRRVLWAPTGTPQIDIAGSYTVQDAFGTELIPDGRHFLGISPIYVFGDVTVSMTPGQDVLLADNFADFSTTQGQDGWTYQSLIGTTYTNAEVDAVAGEWVETDNPVWQINATHQHPAVNGTTKIAAVRKWTAPANGRVRVQGTWRRGAGGDGSDVSIWLWQGAVATVRFRRSALSNSTVDIDQVFDVTAGDVIEFRAGIGPAFSHDFDDTVLEILIFSTIAAVNEIDDDQGLLTNPGDPDLTHAINDGLALFVGGAPAGALEVGTERISRNALLFVGGNAARADPDISGWLIPEVTSVNGVIYVSRPALWNSDMGARYAIWMDVIIDAHDQWSSLFTIAWRDAWSAPFAALQFQRSGTTNQCAVNMTPASGTGISITSPAGAWPGLGRHRLGMIRDGNLTTFVLNGSAVGSPVGGMGTAVPGWDAAAKQKPISLLGRSETVTTGQGVDGAVVQMRFWEIPTGATVADMVARMATLQTAPNTGRHTGGARTRLPPGTIENFDFMQAPTHSYAFNINVIAQSIAANLPLYGFRHNLTMVRREISPGVFSFQGPWAYDHVGGSNVPYSIQWDAMHAAGIYLLGCLFEGGNGGDYPKTATERNFWADQAVAIMLYLEAGWPGMLVAVEIENEPDGNWPVPAVDMALIAAALKPKVRAKPALDHIPIIGPAVVASPGAYCTNYINAGGLDNIDYWSIHIYAPANKWMTRETILRPQFVAAGHPNMKMIITEWGGHGTSNRHESVADGAAMLASGFVGSSYFPIRDMSGFANNGFLNSNGSLAEQGQTHLTFLDLVGWDATYVGEDPITDHVVSYHFLVNGAHVRVMWSFTDEPTSITITGAYTVKDSDGNDLNNPGQIQVINVPPIYLFGNVSVAMSAVQDTLLADSSSGFSMTQGQNGWTYQRLESGVYTNATADTANNRWIHPSYAAWQLGQINMQPVTNAAGTAAVCSVRKWTVPAGVTRVRVRAIWQRVSLLGDGGGLSLWHWRGAVATKHFDRRDLMGTSEDFIRVIIVLAGDVIEFRADTGPALNDVGDETKLNICKIYRTAGPATDPAP